jgi:hypothetical protein
MVEDISINGLPESPTIETSSSVIWSNLAVSSDTCCVNRPTITPNKNLCWPFFVVAPSCDTHDRSSPRCVLGVATRRRSVGKHMEYSWVDVPRVRRSKGRSILTEGWEPYLDLNLLNCKESPIAVVLPPACTCPSDSPLLRLGFCKVSLNLLVSLLSLDNHCPLPLYPRHIPVPVPQRAEAITQRARWHRVRCAVAAVCCHALVSPSSSSSDDDDELSSPHDYPKTPRNNNDSDDTKTE